METVKELNELIGASYALERKTPAQALAEITGWTLEKAYQEISRYYPNFWSVAGAAKQAICKHETKQRDVDTMLQQFTGYQDQRDAMTTG